MAIIATKVTLFIFSLSQDYILNLANDPVKNKICKQRVLCRTLAGNLVYVLTITSPSKNPEDIKHKKAVVLTSRVHPGESNASWMMKGFLDYLTSNSADAKVGWIGTQRMGCSRVHPGESNVGLAWVF